MDAELELLRKEARALLPGAIELRRRIHRQPELGLVLPETQKAVLESLADLGLEIHTGGATSAVVAVLRGARPGPTLLLRADMDALPMQEDTDLPFRSERDGAMHACGHDAHVAMLASAARLLAARRDTLEGTRKFLFQPGEEGHARRARPDRRGAPRRRSRVDAAFAIHVDSSLPAGLVATRPGPLMAAGDLFSIDVIGKGGHAAQPHLARDPIPGRVRDRDGAPDAGDAPDPRLRPGDHLGHEDHGRHGRQRDPREGASARHDPHGVGDGARAARTSAWSARCAASRRRTGSRSPLHVIPGYPVTVNHDGFTALRARVAGDLLGADARAGHARRRSWAPRTSRTCCSACPARWCSSARAAEGSGGAPLHSNRMVHRRERAGRRHRAPRRRRAPHPARPRSSDRRRHRRPTPGARAALNGPLSPRAARVLYNVSDALAPDGAPAADVAPAVERAIRHRGVGTARRMWLLLQWIEWLPRLALKSRRGFSWLPREQRRALARRGRGKPHRAGAPVVRRAARLDPEGRSSCDAPGSSAPQSSDA